MTYYRLCLHIGEKILRQACTLLNENGCTDMAGMLADGRKLFHELIELANNTEEEKDKRIRVNIGKRLSLLRFLVPVQAALTVSLPRSTAATHGRGGGGGGALPLPGSQPRHFTMPDAYYDAFPNSQMQIRVFGEFAQVLHSKAKPKKIVIYTTCEKKITFLCKQERSGDLRKDARLMEFNGIVNRLLQRDAEGRRRKLRLRTYAVICLNEECGLMEWVPNTAPFRNMVHESVRWSGTYVNHLRFGELRSAFEGNQINNRENLPLMAKEYKEVILSRYVPTFHQWFLLHFPEPTAWLEARTTFTRSTAVWSAVGHVVGLGDRHGENILLDTASGEAVHVDFDCLFDKGLTLARPELVPFRLTPNMVDAMGVTGYEGSFRRVMEVTLTVLREHRLTLLSVLEPFLSDPTVGWEHASKGYNVQFLTIIDERLRGIYNLRVPQRVGRSASSRKAAAAAAAAAAKNEVALPLSVPGHVQKLIHEATSLESLAQMYVGWMPWI